MASARRLLPLAGVVLVNLAAVLVLLEIALRAFPVLLPLDRLVGFDPGIREDVARRRGLPTLEGTTLLSRDDGGPPLRLPKPGSSTYRPSKDEGAVEILRMDSLGFCNPPELATKPSVDLVTIGDSFTFCSGVEPENAWAQRLGELAGGLTAYNLGRGGIGVHEYLQILKQYGIGKSPRIVVMNIYEGNDLRDALYYREYLKQSAEPGLPGQRVAPKGPGWLAAHSYVYNLLARPGRGGGVARGKRHAASLHDGLKETYYPINFRYRLQFPDQIVAFNVENTDKDEPLYAFALRDGRLPAEVFQDIERPLKEFVRLSKEHHFIPVVSYTPSAHIVYSADVVFEDKRLTELMPWFSRQQREFFKSRAGLGYVFIDLVPALQEAARTSGPGRLLYNRYDLHFTQAGHEALAGILDQSLRERGILPLKTPR